MKTQRKEMILQTIDNFGVVSVKQLHEILNIGSYRYTCKLIQELEDYLIIERTKQKKIYLNLKGKEYIGSTTNINLDNDYYFENQIYLFFKKPAKKKKNVEIKIQSNYEGVEVKGLNVAQHLKITVPAVFHKGAYLCLVEIDGNRRCKKTRIESICTKKCCRICSQRNISCFILQKQMDVKKD